MADEQHEAAQAHPGSPGQEPQAGQGSGTPGQKAAETVGARTQAQAPTPQNTTGGDPEVAEDHIAAQDQRMRDAREADEENQRELNESVARGRAQAAERYADSEQGAAHAQIEEAERIMRLPTPKAHEELGSNVGDPLQGPSS